MNGSKKVIMDSYFQAPAKFLSSSVERSVPFDSSTNGPANHGDHSIFSNIQHEGCLNSENQKSNGNSSAAGEEEIVGEGQPQVFEGILDIYVHHARDIHNICIYDKQDVYAKLSLTSNPEGALSTRISNGGGRNPVFNESLQMKINNQVDASLKCELWMLSRARNYMEDQLLGFVVVPLSTVAGKGKSTQDFIISSTDLFHSPAGIVQLTLAYHGSAPPACQSKSIAEAKLAISSAPVSSDIVSLDGSVENPEPTNYNDIEFPDLQVASENNLMVSEYFKMASNDLKPENGLKRDLIIADPNESEFSGTSFLHLGPSPATEDEDDYDMAPNVTVANCPIPSTTIAHDDNVSDYQAEPDAEIPSTIIISGTTSSSTQGQGLRDFVAQKSGSSEESSRFQKISSPSESTSLNDNVSSKNQEKSSSVDSDKGGAASTSEAKTSEGETGISFTTPLVSVNLEPEQTVVQEQIVDMYMKSMQQFTESLAKMKLPMDIENQQSDDSVKSGTDPKTPQSGRNAGSRVFYGSRAFF